MTPGYPPYNIERTGENDYRITVAVAGFAETELTIELKENTLTIRGEKQAKTDEKSGEVLYQGIAARAFERVFQLADFVQVKGAALENGLLHVDLVREIPEAKKPRQIAIQRQVASQGGDEGLRTWSMIPKSGYRFSGKIMLVKKRSAPVIRGAFIFASRRASPERAAPMRGIGADDFAEMMPQRFRSTEAAKFGDPLDRLVGAFQQILRAANPQPDQPFDRRGAGRGPEAAGEIAHAHRRAFGQGLDRDRLLEIGRHPVGDRGNAVIGTHRDRLHHELRLPAVAMRRHDQAARKKIG